MGGRVWQNVVCKRKAEAYFVFQTFLQRLDFSISYSATTTISILPRQHERTDRFLQWKNEVGQSVTSYLNKTVDNAVPC